MVTFEMIKLPKHISTYRVNYSYVAGIVIRKKYYRIDTIKYEGTEYALLEDYHWGEDAEHLIVNMTNGTFVAWTQNGLATTLIEKGIITNMLTYATENKIEGYPKG